MGKQLNIRALTRDDGIPARAVAVARQAPGLTAMVAMALIGIGIAIYLTVEHYTKGPLACPLGGGVVDCAKVTTSAFSVVPGTQLPITVPGLLWFLVSGGLAGFALLRLAQHQPEPPRLRLAHVLWAAAGLVFVFYLVYAELVVLHSICAWCTVIHVMTFLTFIIALSRFTQPEPAYIAAPAPRQPERRGHHGTARAQSRNQVSSRAATQRQRATPPRSRRHR